MQLTLKRLKQILWYEPETGRWTWLITQGKAYAGAQAGVIRQVTPAYCRREIVFAGTRYKSGRLAYFYMTGRWPAQEVDHENGDALDDRWSNLRPASRTQQGQNVRPHRDSITGLKGVLVNRSDGRKPRRKIYQARIRVNGKNISLGYYLTAEEAHAVYAEAAKQHFGEFARSE